MSVIRACAFDFPFSVPRSRSGGYDERKLEQTSKPANPRRQTALYENPRRQTAFYENTRRQMVFPTLTLWQRYAIALWRRYGI